MFVSDWMTKKVYSITPDDSISDAIRLMKEHRVKHLPVMKEEKVKGMVSDRDIRDFSPSRATSLDIYELHYLIARTKVREIMQTKVVATTPETPIEEAAMLLYDKNIGCLPAVENGRLAGIISDRDIFRALIEITGVRHGGHRIFGTIEDRPGSIKEIADVIRKYGFSLQSILTSYARVKEGFRNVVIRTKGRGNFSGISAELERTFAGVKIRKGQ
jgi:acetoin utilization protein AcuB